MTTLHSLRPAAVEPLRGRRADHGVPAGGGNGET